MNIDSQGNVTPGDDEEFICAACGKRFDRFDEVRDTSCMTWLHVVKRGTNESVAFTP